MLSIPQNGAHLAQTAAATRPSPNMSVQNTTDRFAQVGATPQTSPSPPPPANANTISSADPQAILQGIIATSNASESAGNTNVPSQRLVADAQIGYGGATPLNVALSQVK